MSIMSHFTPRSNRSRSLLRKHSAVIFPILLLYLYLLFFAGHSDTRGRAGHSKGRKTSAAGSVSFFERSDWQNVHHPSYNFSVYSAYSYSSSRDKMSSPEVHVIAGYRTFEEEPVRCRFYFDVTTTDAGHETSVVVPGHIETIAGWDFRFAGNFIKCRMPIETEDVNDVEGHPMKKPSYVSILIGNQTQSVNRLEIQYRASPSERESGEAYQFQFSACVLPVSEQNSVFHFIEWFEFHKMMGVEQFTVYDAGISSELRCVMRELRNEEHDAITLNIFPWQQYPVQNFSISRYGLGLSAAANDCLLRHKGVSKYVMMVDVDEFIMAQEETGLQNYAELLAYLGIQNMSAEYAEFVFQNGFYERNREKDDQLMDRCSPLKSNAFQYYTCQELYVMQYVKRENFQREGQRTKYIFRPERVNIAGYHQATKLESGFESQQVSEDIAFSRHYRYFNEGPTVEIDKVASTLGIKLARKVAQSTQNLMEKCKFTLGDIFRN